MSRLLLLRGGISLGIVERDAAESDFPWHVGRLQPAEEFAAVRPLFDEQERALQAEDWDAHDAIADEILRPGIVVKHLDSGEDDEVVGITINGDRVAWR